MGRLRKNQPGYTQSKDKNGHTIWVPDGSARATNASETVATRPEADLSEKDESLSYAQVDKMALEAKWRFSALTNSAGEETSGSGLEADLDDEPELNVTDHKVFHKNLFPEITDDQIKHLEKNYMLLDSDSFEPVMDGDEVVEGFELNNIGKEQVEEIADYLVIDILPHLQK